MPAIGGSIESVTLDGREFAVTADADVGRKLGGRENEMLANGNRTSRLIKTATPWSAEGLTVAIDDDNGDQEFIQALADSNHFFAIAITYPSGAVSQGEGQIAGEVVFNNQTASASVSLMGTGILTKQ